MKNHIIKALRISKEMDDLLNEASEKLGFKKSELIRFLLNRSLHQLKSDSVLAGGFNKLTFSLRKE